MVNIQEDGIMEIKARSAKMNVVMYVKIVGIHTKSLKKGESCKSEL